MSGYLWTLVHETTENEFLLVPLFSIRDRKDEWTQNDLPTEPVSFLDMKEGKECTGILKFIGNSQEEVEAEKTRLQSSLQYAQLQNLAPSSSISVEDLSSLIDSIVKKRLTQLDNKVEVLNERVENLESVHQFAKEKLLTSDDYEVVSCKHPFNVTKNDLKSAVLVKGADCKGFVELYKLAMPTHVNHINKKFSELTTKEKIKVKALISHFVASKMNHEKKNPTQESSTGESSTGDSPPVLGSISLNKKNPAAPARSRKRKSDDLNEKKTRNPPSVDATNPKARFDYILSCFYQYLNYEKKQYLEKENARLAKSQDQTPKV